MSAWCVWALLPGPAAGWSKVAGNLSEEDARLVADALVFPTRPMPEGVQPA
jgi:hypothetical protein